MKMKNLLERLRESRPYSSPLEKEAADRIEDLEDQIALLVEDLEIIEIMPFYDIEEIMEFASDSLIIHRKLKCITG